MTTEQEKVREWMKAFGQDTPDKPTMPDLETRRLRAKLILEEALETIKALGFIIQEDASNCDGAYEFHIIENNPPDLAEIIDGCEDLKVVTEGTLIACGCAVRMPELDDEKAKGMDILEVHGYYLQDPYFNEVMRSNFSKLWRKSDVAHIPAGWTVQSVNEAFCVVKDEAGKIRKPASYSPADIKTILENQKEGR